MNNIFNFKKNKNSSIPIPVTACERDFFLQNNSSFSRMTELKLYEDIKDSIPIIHGAIDKIIRLLGVFNIECKNKTLEYKINKFCENVKVNSFETGLLCFILNYFDQLLTYGTAVAEIVLNKDNSDIYSLYNVPLKNIEIIQNDNPLDVSIFSRDSFGNLSEISSPELILISPLNPKSGDIYGQSILKGLPFITDILMKIYDSIGKNWERVGNVRFAVTYKPENDISQRGVAKERAMAIAEEWGKAMNSSSQLSDFIAIGDVDVKVIGADNQILDSSVPVKQLIEQIVAKLSVPPFLLGLSWSTTERMSSQQADILTSELSSYRRMLNPIIKKIINTYLKINGEYCDYSINWNYINLQDEVELANARLTNARASQIEISIGEDDNT